MKQAQKDLINQAILPKLIEMAIDGTLPSDMNDLSVFHFEDEIKQFNINNQRKDALGMAIQLLSVDDEDTVEKQVTNIERAYEDSSNHDMFIENVEGVHPVQKFEYVFTVEDFLNEIGLI